MYPRDQLRRTLARIDGRPYPAYRDLGGAYDFGALQLHIDHVQPDPFAAPSRLRVVVPAANTGLDPAGYPSPRLRIGLEDWLLRRLAAALHRAAEPEATGPGAPPALEGELPASCLHVLEPGQQVLERSAVAFRRSGLEVRLTCHLPATSRMVFGAKAAAALDVALPAAVGAMLPAGPADLAHLGAHLALLEDQEALRQELARRGWVAFVADGSILARASGDSDRPLSGPAAVRLQAPADLAQTVELPRRGPVRGLPIRSGVTLIVGGAYHGKSTLLRALARGVYDHIAGDGRELCLSVPRAVAIAAEDGRPVAGTDIAAFVRPLPGGVSTTAFRTTAASGSTSQAAGLCEALELGADCLLLDEDTSAANFMSRDARMRALVPDAEDPVVPFADRVRQLWEGRGTSTVLVAGGSGTFLAVADQVIRLRDYQPQDVTAQARAIAAAMGQPEHAVPKPPAAAPARVLAADAFAALAGSGGRVRARPRGREALAVGDVTISLHALSQLVEDGQLVALADMLARAAAYTDGRRTLAQIVREVEADVDRLGLEACSPWPGQCPGDYARPRGFELAAAINRLPHLALAGEAPPIRPVVHRRLAAARPGGTSARPPLIVGRPAGRPHPPAPGASPSAKGRPPAPAQSAGPRAPAAARPAPRGKVLRPQARTGLGGPVRDPAGGTDPGRRRPARGGKP